MMPTVNISSQNFQRLQSKATPLIDDLDSVLARLLDFYEQHHSPSTEVVAEVPDDLTVQAYDADNPPDLTFTSLKSITLAGEHFPNRYWNPLMFAVVAKAVQKIGLEKVKPYLEGNSSEKENKNYQHVPEAGLWVQGREANLCWRQINKLAKAANIPVEVEFYWQENSKALKPGRSGRFVVEAK